MVSNTRPNRDIRRAAAFSGVCLWQIADSLGITDANFSRKLRRELPADEKEKIMQIMGGGCQSIHYAGVDEVLPIGRTEAPAEPAKAADSRRGIHSLV